MAELKVNQKKQWAQLLITREGLTQKEAAETVGVSTVTMNKWFNAGKWDVLKQSMLITRQEQLSRLYMQLEELTSMIKDRDQGSRFANNKEADTIIKITSAIKSMETEASLGEIVEVSQRFLNWLRKLQPDKAKEIADIFDDFIKATLKR